MSDAKPENAKPPQATTPAPSAPAVVDPTKTFVAAQWKAKSPFISCRWDPQGRYVFAGAQDNTVVRFDASGKTVELVGHDSWVRGIAATPDGKTLLTGGNDGRLIWWPLADDGPKPLRKIDAHQGWVRAVVMNGDGTLAVTCGNDHLVRLWSVVDGALVREFKGHQSHVYHVALHPGGKELVSIDIKGNLKHWDLSDGREIRSFAAADLFKFDPVFHADIGGARGMEFSPDGKTLACAGITNVTNAFAGIGIPAVVLIDWEKGVKKLLHRPKADYQASSWGLNFHPAGFLVAVDGGGGGGHLLFFKPEAANEFFSFKLPGTGRDMHLSPDGLRVAVAHFDDHVRVYELRAKPA